MKTDISMMQDILREFDIQPANSGVSTGSVWLEAGGEKLVSFSPVDGKDIAGVTTASRADYDAVVRKAGEAFAEWRQWPAPRRGEVVRQVGQALRAHKESLGRLVSYEMGKSLQEG
ncbi:MAG: aldehyde dehydrogenase family protein, partial [Chitinophaga sp.]